MKNNYFKLFLLISFVLSSFTLSAQSKVEIAKISSKNNTQKLTQLKTELTQRARSQKQEAIRIAKQRGWDVLKKNDDGSYDELIRVSKDGKPIYYSIYNVAAARSTRANHVNTGGSLGLNLDGQGMTAHVWDGGGTRPSHQEFAGGRITIIDGSTLNGNSFHAQHVTGTVGAAGVDPAAKGMAPQTNLRTADWNNDLAEATAETSNGMLVSNHSYGFRASQVPDYYFGAYIQDSRDWDNVMYNAPMYLMVVAAGNDGNDNSSNANPLGGNSSYDKLTGHSTSKNNMVVANAQDANIDANGNLVSVSINSSSSEGPTDDLRIKPDITGNGTQVYSTYDNSDTAYNSITGTSMASPNIAGSLLLLQQHYNNLNSNFMRAATLKGLALHTADDAGSNGPDPVFGWGLMNTKRAAEAITANGNGAIISELTLSPGQTYTTTVDADGVNDLLASISWTDPAGSVNNGTANLTTPVLVNDLDIRVTQNSATFSPYRLTSITSNGTGDNTVDPFERIDVSGASGTYTITVTHKGSLTNGSQNFSLIVTGVSSTPVVCDATTPQNVTVSNVTASEANVNWSSVTAATYDVRYRIVGTSSWTTNAISGTTTTLSGLSPLSNYEVQVRSKCSDGSTSNYSASATFSTQELSLNYCSSQGNNINDEYIGRVQLGSIDNSSGAVSGYQDFTNISTDLAKGESHTITITPTWTGTVYNEGYAVWIDYNKNGTFDSNERVYSQAATNTSPVSGSFTVPTTAVDGAVRMRVSMKYNGLPTECETFTYGQVEDYTVVLGESSGPGPDTQAPTAPTNLSASNVTQTTVDLSWNASTDNVGVTEYDVYSGSSNLGSVTGTSANITGLVENTTYSFTVRAKDAAGNVSNTSSTLSVTTQAASGGGAPVVLHQGFFESGWDGWIDGGSDSFRYSGSRSFEGNYSIRIRDNSGTRSAMTLNNVDVSPFDTVEVKFYFYAFSMENGEDFFVRFYDGSQWNTVATYARGTNFDNNTFYSATVSLSSAQYNFAVNSGFRFQCDASSNADQIYIDQVTITGLYNSGASTNSLNVVQSFTIFSETDADTGFEGDFLIYPNPVIGNSLNIRMPDSGEASYRIMDITGKQIKAGTLIQNTISVNELSAGMYLIELNDGEETMTQKFIRR